MGSDAYEAHKTDAVLKSPSIVRVYYAQGYWVKDGVVRGWKVIIEHKGQLQWVLTYHKQLIENGDHSVEFTRNSQYERTIKPWKG